MRFEFVVRSGKDTGRTVALDAGQTIGLGRLKGSDMTVDDEAAGLTLEEAVRLMKDLEGKAFDPVVVKAAIELHEKGELALPTTPNLGVTTVET